MTPANARARSGWWALVWSVARHPTLWPVALRQTARFRRSGWWHRRPFLPVPDPGLMRFRMVTAYGGDGSGLPEPEDLLAWLEWCRAETSSARIRPGHDAAAD